MATRPLNGRQRQGRNLAGVAIAAVCLAAAGVGVASGSGGSSARQSGGPTEPRLQPLVTHPAPDGTRRVRLGQLRVKPTAIVAGAEDQDIRITLDPGGAGGPARVGIRLYRPADPSAGRGLGRYNGPKRSLRLSGGSARSLTLRDLNLPAGDYKLRLTNPAGKPIGGSKVVVYAQHRLPPGAGRGSSGGEDKAGTRALPSPSVNNNISFVFGQQAETYTAVEDDNPARLAASVNPDGGNPDVWISNDSMRPGSEVMQTMSSSTLRRVSEGGPGPFNIGQICCDPALTADDRGNIWLSHLATTDVGATQNYILINRISGPGGTSLQPNNVAVPRLTSLTQDKPMARIDSWATSPKRYRIYVVWIENAAGSQQNVVINECNAATASTCDSPENWADTPAAVQISGDVNSYPSVATAPNGDVYVAWWDATTDQILIDRCLAAEDCNLDASWNELTIIDNDLDPGSASPLPFFCPIIGAPGGRVGPQTYVAVGPDSRVYVAYSELRDQSSLPPPFGTTRCTAEGTDRTFESRIAAGAANTFPALNSGVRISDDSATALNDHFFPSLAADPSVAGRVESSLYSTKLDSSGDTTDQFYVSSSNGGVSYSAMTRITTDSSDFSGGNSDGFDYGDYEGADAAAGLFFPVWTDNRAAHGGDAELYMLTPDVATPPPPPPSSTTPPTPTPAAPSAFCRGKPAIAGTSGANALTGTAVADALAGLGGKDTLRGKGGNDVLCGGGGKDRLIGGGGKDVCVGGAGRDTARGCEKRKSI